MGSRFFSSWITIFVLFLFNLNPSFALAKTGHCTFPAIFNFGDSNSDTGGLSAVFGQAPPPHGMSFFGGPAGRYCDGRLIVDFIAEAFGLPYVSAYLDSIGSDFSNGANFATAGSTVRPQNTTLQQSGFSPISLNVQWNEFYDFHQRSQIVRNHTGVYKILLPNLDAAYKRLPKAQYFSKALYTFDIGQNDLTAGYFSNMTTDQVKAYVPEVVTQLQNVIRYIHGLGGRNFWIHNTGPVGCLPYVLERIPVLASQVDEVGCATPFNEVAKYFNSLLKAAVVQLRKDLPSAALTYVDVYSVKYALFDHQGRKHGFKQSIRTCCGHGGRYNYNINVGCGGSKKIHGKQVLLGKPCEDPSDYVVWDGVHFTQAANKFIFEQIAGGAFSDPPIPLNMACNRF